MNTCRSNQNYQLLQPLKAGLFFWHSLFNKEPFIWHDFIFSSTQLNTFNFFFDIRVRHGLRIYFTEQLEKFQPKDSDKWSHLGSLFKISKQALENLTSRLFYIIFTFYKKGKMPFLGHALRFKKKMYQMTPFITN